MTEFTPNEEELAHSINPDQLVIEGLERINDTLPVDFKYQNLDERLTKEELAKLDDIAVESLVKQVPRHGGWSWGYE